MTQPDPAVPNDVVKTDAAPADTGTGIPFIGLVLAIIVLLTAIGWVLTARPLAGSRTPITAPATAPTAAPAGTQSQTGTIRQ